MLRYVLVIYLLLLGGLLEVLHKVGDVVIIVIIALGGSTLGSGSLLLELLSQGAQVLHVLRAQLADDAGKQLRYISVYAGSADNEGVALHSRLNLGVGEMKDGAVVSKHVDLLNTGDHGGTELLHDGGDLLVIC